MNDRIYELAEQAAEFTDANEFAAIERRIWDGIFREKFAELIIQECMRMCEVTEMSFVTHGCDVEASGAITVKQFIAEHFGVE